MFLLFFFLIIDFYLLIIGVIAQIFIPIAELPIPTRVPPKEANTEMVPYNLI